MSVQVLSLNASFWNLAWIPTPFSFTPLFFCPVFEYSQCANFTSPYPGYINPNTGNTMLPFPWYKRVYTFQADGNSSGYSNPKGFCYNEQPVWSQIREPSFGHGTLDVIDERTALWWVQKSKLGGSYMLDVWFTRDVCVCVYVIENVM